MQSTSLVRVRYAETDQMGVVYYANYLVWFEVGRADWLRALGSTWNRQASSCRSSKRIANTGGHRATTTNWK